HELQFAARHGRRRKKDGYTAAMLVREFQVIGETVYDLLGGDLLPLGVVELTSDLKLLIQSLNIFTLVSFEAYARAKLASIKNAHPVFRRTPIIMLSGY